MISKSPNGPSECPRSDLLGYMCQRDQVLPFSVRTTRLCDVGRVDGTTAALASDCTFGTSRQSSSFLCKYIYLVNATSSSTMYHLLICAITLHFCLYPVFILSKDVVIDTLCRGATELRPKSTARWPSGTQHMVDCIQGWCHRPVRGSATFSVLQAR